MAVIDSYVPADDEVRLSDSTKKQHPRLSLLALALKGKIEDQDGQFSLNEEETTQFNTESHVQFLRGIFKFYGWDFDKWCLCLNADNTSVNSVFVIFCENPFVGCNSYKFHLDGNQMVLIHNELSSTIDQT